MKIKQILSATLAAAMLMCCCALTACASKPAAPTAADFEVQPGADRYQDMGDFFVETEQGQYYRAGTKSSASPSRAAGPSTPCAISPTADMAAITAMHTPTMHWDTGTGIFTPPPTETTVR